MPYKNKADADARNRRYYRAHKEAIKAYAKKWFMENEEKQIEKIKAWRKTHRKRVRRYTRKWRERHREQHLASERRRKKAKRLREKGIETRANPIAAARKLVAKADALAIQGKYGIDRIGNRNP